MLWTGPICDSVQCVTKVSQSIIAVTFAPARASNASCATTALWSSELM